MTEISNRERYTDMTAERRLGQRMHAFSNMISANYYKRTEQPFGVSLPEWRVLRSVIIQPSISQVEIAAEEGLNVMNVSRAVAGLRRKGLVEVEADPDDRRRNVLVATAEGLEVGTDIADRERVIYEHIYSVLSPDERAMLDGFLDRVNSFVRDTEFPDAPEPSRDWAAILRER